jgi:hypothetical protein
MIALNAPIKTPMDYIETEEQYFADQGYSDDDEDAPSIMKLSRASDEFDKIIMPQFQVYNEYWKNF